MDPAEAVVKSGHSVLLLCIGAAKLVKFDTPPPPPPKQNAAAATGRQGRRAQAADAQAQVERRLATRAVERVPRLELEADRRGLRMRTKRISLSDAPGHAVDRAAVAKRSEAAGGRGKGSTTAHHGFNGPFAQFRADCWSAFPPFASATRQRILEIILQARGSVGSHGHAHVRAARTRVFARACARTKGYTRKARTACRRGLACGNSARGTLTVTRASAR